MSAINSIPTCGCRPPVDINNNPTHARTTMEGGKAMFENDTYKISANDDNNVVIFNKKTGEEYNIWGDPHVKVDGKQSFDFWGTTTFNLDDGTKVTIDTTPWNGNQNATLASQVTITNGDYGVQISGVDSNIKGDLKYNETTANGWLMDAMVNDGNAIYENPVGKGFVAVDDCGHVRTVDQQYINETDLTKGGALQDKHIDAFKELASLISISIIGYFMREFMPAPQDGSNAGSNERMPMPETDYGFWPGGTPPWIFDEAGLGRDGRPVRGDNFMLMMTRDINQIADLQAAFNR
jgi:hypothetical protein